MSTDFKVGDGGANLSDIVGGMGLDSAPGDQEVRFNGKVLYARDKDSSGIFESKLPKRRQAAVDQVVSGFAKQYGISTELAEKVMLKVLDLSDKPAALTVSQIRKLDEQGYLGKAVRDEGDDKGSGIDTAVAKRDALKEWLGSKNYVDDGALSTLMMKMEKGGITLDRAKELTGRALDFFSGTINADQMWSDTDDKEKAALAELCGLRMRQLSSYDGQNAAVWERLAVGVSRYCPKEIGNLNAGQRASFHNAMAGVTDDDAWKCFAEYATQESPASVDAMKSKPRFRAGLVAAQKEFFAAPPHPKTDPDLKDMAEFVADCVVNKSMKREDAKNLVDAADKLIEGTALPADTAKKVRDLRGMAEFSGCLLRKMGNLGAYSDANKSAWQQIRDYGRSIQGNGRPVAAWDAHKDSLAKAHDALLASELRTMRTPNIPDGELMWMSPSAVRFIENGMDPGKAKRLALIAHDVCTGTSNAETAKNQVGMFENDDFATFLEAKMKTLPEAESSNGTDLDAWRRMAECFGTFIGTGRAKNIDLGLRVSMHNAWSAQGKKIIDVVIAAANTAGASVLTATPTQKTDYQHVCNVMLRMNKCFKPEEVMMRDHQKKVDAFIDAVNKDNSIKTAKKNWERLTDAEKTTCVEAILKHHTDAFGYPRIAGTDLLTTFSTGAASGSLTYGYYNNVQNKLSLNLHKDAVDPFEELIDTIVHESIHRCQHKEPKPAVTTDPKGYQRWRLMTSNFDSYFSTTRMTNDFGVNANVANQLYQLQPCEFEAFRIGQAGRKVSI